MQLFYSVRLKENSLREKQTFVWVNLSDEKEIESRKLYSILNYSINKRVICYDMNQVWPLLAMRKWALSFCFCIEKSTHCLFNSRENSCSFTLRTSSIVFEVT